MTPWLLIVALGLLFGSGLFALCLSASNRGALWAATLGNCLASLIGIVAAGQGLLSGNSWTMRLAWSFPLGTLSVGLDPLSAFFLLCIFLVSGLASLYGAAYLSHHASQRRLAPVLFFFSLLVASMVGVVVARDGVLFLVAWEIMSVAGFFLVTFEHAKEETRRAGLVYLIASHVGVLALLTLFTLLSAQHDSYAFVELALPSGTSSSLANSCFWLALVGFGTKAGFWMLHTWLPEAHPAAPSHVSATMSGVMIKMGIYGLLRLLTLLGTPKGWWGTTLIAVGAISGILGVLHALAQHDLKRLLAYHSVENIGIIVLGVGLGVLGQSYGNTTMAYLGYAGAILHTLNHGLFKSLLFQGAGCVWLEAGTKELDRLGGLARKMPTCALGFLVGAIAICGLPPLNGFVSEWLIYVAAFRGGSLQGPALIAAVAVIPSLALIGGLAAACFVKAYGVIFLGEPRSRAASAAKDPPALMRLPMVLLALSCLGIGLFPAFALAAIEQPVRVLVGGTLVKEPLIDWLSPVARVAFTLLGAIVLLSLLRAWLLRGREQSVVSTWGCGYEAPSARMQYTAASFAQPVLAPFDRLLDRRLHVEFSSGYFPEPSRYEIHPGDLAGQRLILPLIRRLVSLLGRVKVLQHGRLQLYLMYILATVVLVLLWQLGGSR